MQMCIATLRPLKFFSPKVILNWKRRIFISKEKKEKKKAIRLVEGFKKASFFKKNTTWYFIGNRGFKIKVECFAKRYRWRFFLKPVGLEIAFLNTCNLSLLPFFIYFFFEISIQMSLFNRILSEVISIDLKDRHLWKGYQILWMDEKTNQTIKTLFIRPKNLILFRGFDFWGCLKVS